MAKGTRVKKSADKETSKKHESEHSDHSEHSEHSDHEEKAEVKREVDAYTELSETLQNTLKKLATDVKAASNDLKELTKLRNKEMKPRKKKKTRSNDMIYSDVTPLKTSSSLE
jgi:hypothetical protein